MHILSTHDLTKHYGHIRAVDGISLHIEEGSIYGILGPNGSGKTTTLAILLDIIKSQRGSFKWFENEPSHKSRQRIGALLESPNFYDYLSGEKNLKIAAQIKNAPVSDIGRVLEIVDLYDRKDSLFKSYSLGMKQRLALASALLGNPEVLLLDEPTNGLDPQGISEVRDLILNVASDGITVILASHMLDEVEKVCTHVGILKNGKLLVEGKVEEILGEEKILEVKSEDLTRLEEVLQGFNKVIEIKAEKGVLIVKLSEDTTNEEVNEFLFNHGIILNHLAGRKKKLEMQFLELTN